MQTREERRRVNASQTLEPAVPGSSPAPRRSRVLGLAVALVWFAGPAIAAYAIYVDDWRPLLAILPLLVLDNVLFDKWIDSDPSRLEREEREADELFTDDEADELLAELPDDASALDDLIFVLDNPEPVQRRKYAFRGALVLRSAGTVAQPVGWSLLVAALPGRPLLGAVGAVLAVAAGGGHVYQLTQVLAPRLRVRATDEDRRRWLRRDRVVEIALWSALAVLVGYKLIEGA